MVQEWPVVPGDYTLGSGNSPVAVLIIGRGTAELDPSAFAIKGTLKTENMGLEKVVVNIVTNPRIRFLIVCGKEEFGHFPADAILCLVANGVDAQMRIVGSRSAIPFLCNLPLAAVERFQSQVEVVDLVHPKDVSEIVAYDPEYQFDDERVKELHRAISACLARDPGSYPEGPLTVESESLMIEGPRIASQLNKLSDDFVGQMLRMPSERLSTSASIAVISTEFRTILDPVDGLVRTVPSVEFAGRLQKYLRGEL